ncbi:MAG: NAD-dependent epimerase/dehydratase family protein [Candidatus Hodarchaeales archaeon]
MNILVTGASGFIGKAFVKSLIKENLGYDIYCAVRKTSKIDELKELGVNFVDFDLTDYSTFGPAVKNMDTVVHFAANFDFLASEESLFALNVDATKELAEASLENGVKHFIYCSSTEAVGNVIDATEDSEYNPDEVYGRSKMEAEKILLDMHAEKGLPVTIARPSGVFGPGDNYVFKEMIISVDRSIINKVFPTSAKSKIHFTYIDDVVQGFIKIVQNREKAVGQIYHLTSDEPQTYRQMFTVIAKKLGRRPPIFISPFPVILAKPFWPFIVKFYRWRGFGYPYVPNALKKIKTSRNYLNLKAKQELGFQPKVSFEEGVEKTVEWMRGEGMIKTKLKTK